MPEFLILAEKKSAFDNFVSIFGGSTGSRNGHTFKIVHSHGHLMTLAAPEDQVSTAALKTRYKSWDDLKAMPWTLSDFAWKRTYIKSKNPQTNRVQTTKADIAAIKSAARACDKFVIATDNDPSGEGDLLGWEIVNAIDWHKPVYRMRFSSDNKQPILDSFDHMSDISNQQAQGEYLKSETRSRWDFSSMQLSRISTTAARAAGYNVRVVRPGRLKSVIVSWTYHRLQDIAKYVKKPYYEVKYRDDQKHVYTRKYTPDVSDFRWPTSAKGQQDLQQYGPDTVQEVSRKVLHQQPPKLLNLGSLGARLASQFHSSEILKTYQKMYQAKVVSYPRTMDTKITKAQFDEMLPYIDKIAAAVGVDPALLTHRTLRSSHEIKVADHGANRPGVNVPTSLGALTKYGRSAKAIYQMLALNYLAMICEDYQYEQVKAQLVDHPEFKTTFSVPKTLNWRAIYDDHPDKQADTAAHTLGTTAKAFLATGANPKPPVPNQSRLEAYLDKYNVGSGATRLSTISEVTSGKYAEIRDSRNKFTLTDIGKITAILMENTWISSVDVTSHLNEGMAKIADKSVKPEVVLNSVTELVAHDKPIILANSTQLAPIIGAPKGDLKGFVKKDKAVGTWKGSEISFNRVWSSHVFSDKEVARLLAGKTIEITYTPKSSSTPQKVSGKLAKSSYKGHSFVGFKPNFD